MKWLELAWATVFLIFFIKGINYATSAEAKEASRLEWKRDSLFIVQDRVYGDSVFLWRAQEAARREAAGLLRWGVVP